MGEQTSPSQITAETWNWEPNLSKWSLEIRCIIVAESSQWWDVSVTAQVGTWKYCDKDDGADTGAGDTTDLSLDCFLSLEDPKLFFLSLSQLGPQRGLATAACKAVEDPHSSPAPCGERRTHGTATNSTGMSELLLCLVGRGREWGNGYQ